MAQIASVYLPVADQHFQRWIDEPSNPGMKRNRANTAWVTRRQISAVVALSHDASLAVAALPTMAPAATAAIQSKGANSARVRRP